MGWSSLSSIAGVLHLHLFWFPFGSSHHQFLRTFAWRILDWKLFESPNLQWQNLRIPLYTVRSYLTMKVPLTPSYRWCHKRPPGPTVLYICPWPCVQLAASSLCGSPGWLSSYLPSWSSIYLVLLFFYTLAGPTREFSGSWLLPNIPSSKGWLLPEIPYVFRASQYLVEVDGTCFGTTGPCEGLFRKVNPGVAEICFHSPGFLVLKQK